jgi:hypothetical protein
MSLFDYLTHEGNEYQTKDLPDMYMSQYRIVGGRLLGDEWHMEDVPEDQLPYAEELKNPELSDSQRAFYRIAGCVRRVIDKPNIDLNWHGYLYLVTDHEPYDRYRAKFTDGNLVEFVKYE